MKITVDEIAHVARLARLELDDSDLKRFVGQISDILEYVNALKSVDTENVDPTFHAISLTNAFREDVPETPLKIEDTLSNAPAKEDRDFLVPKIIG